MRHKYPQIILACLMALFGTLSWAQNLPITTNLQIFTPFTTSGLSIGLAITDRAQGSCFASSAADPGRPDAWRCNVGNAIQDPCFIDLAGKQLACAQEPFSANALLLTLEGSLPERAPNRGFDAKAEPWALELANGQRCTPLTGATAPIAGMRINYGCDDDAYVAGPVDRSRPLWRVFYQNPDRSLSLQQVAVTTAWY